MNSRSSFFAVIFLFFLPYAEASSSESALFDGTLGPIRIVASGVHPAAEGEAKRDLRDALLPLFSQNGERLYRISVIADIVETKRTDEYFGGIDGDHKLWNVTLEINEIKPRSVKVGYSEFSIAARAGAAAFGKTHLDASRYFPGYLARRSRIALNQMGGRDQSEELEALSSDMLALRGVGPVSIALDAGISGLIAGTTTVVESASGMKEVMLDPDVMSSVHQVVVEAGSAQNQYQSQPVDEVFADNQREIKAIHDAKIAESQGRRVAGTKERASVQSQVEQSRLSSLDSAEGFRDQKVNSQKRVPVEMEKEAARSRSECVAQSESTGPMPNVPKRYCNYVFSDYTGNVTFSLDDYKSEFMDESHSKESAEETLGFKLLQKAKKQCEAKGYSRVHHNETYEFNEVAVTVGSCKENNRMGSKFYLCGGGASFTCSR